MTYDKAGLRRLVLEELGVISAVEEPTAEDVRLVDGALTRLHARWEGRGLVGLGGTFWTLDAVPDSLADSYTFACAATVMSRYYVPAERRAELLALAGVAEQELRRILALGWDGGPTPVDGIDVTLGDDYGTPREPPVRNSGLIEEI